MNPMVQIDLVVRNDLLNVYIICGEHLDLLGNISNNRRQIFGLIGPKELINTLETKLDEERSKIYIDALNEANNRYFIGDDLYVAL